MEEWKAIPGFEGLYEASNLGRIRTVDGKTTSSARFKKRVWKQRILKVKVKHRNNSTKSDERVTLWKDGKESTHLVARLVAATWIPLSLMNLTVNHINGDTLDNRVENLEWVTLRENIKLGFETGLYDSTKKPVKLIADNGNDVRFKSMSDAARFLSKKCNDIYYCLKNDKPVYDVFGQKYIVERCDTTND